MAYRGRVLITVVAGCCAFWAAAGYLVWAGYA